MALWGQNVPSKITVHIPIFRYCRVLYPSITESLLDKVISWAKTLTIITEEQVSIIKHARKSLLFYGEKTWAKKNNASLFDVTMGSCDGAEIWELVGLFILKEISDKCGIENMGLYRDDGLMLLHGKSGRLADKARKHCILSSTI
jgi:hypothetical protein